MTIKIVSINGADETGKTTQVSLLESVDSVENIPSIASFCVYEGKPDDRGRRIASREWWFARDNGYDFMKVLLARMDNRSRYISEIPDDKIAIVDRGNPMVLASIAAMLRFKNYSSADVIRDVVYNSRESDIKQKDEMRILLKSPGNIKQRVDLTMKRTGIDVNDQFFPIYREYQLLLQEEVDYLECKGIFDKTIVVDRSALEVQNEIRDNLSSKFNAIAPRLGQKINIIYGLAGLSESGKSTIGNLMQKKYGFMRLKQSFFAEALPYKGLQPYHGSASQQAMRIFLGLEKFSTHHHFQGNYTIESLRDVNVTKETKSILGDKFVVVYVDTPRGIATSRAANDLGVNLHEAEEALLIKDLEKNKKGCEEIKAIADIVIDNSGTLSDLKKKIKSINKKI